MARFINVNLFSNIQALKSLVSATLKHLLGLYKNRRHGFIFSTNLKNDGFGNYNFTTLIDLDMSRECLSAFVLDNNSPLLLL